jgi:translation initiation factor 2B subunit (eIF-2B alpha/beta/delta family)
LISFDRQDDETRARLRDAIKAVAADNRSGAAEMLRRASAIFSLLEHTNAEPFVDLEQTRVLIIETCVSLAQAQPLMIPLANLASAVITAAINRASAQEMNDSAISAARDFTDRAERAASLCAQHAAQLISDGATVLTHSRSSTVLASFINARRAGKTFNVIATESRPAMEGRVLARSLADEQIAVTLIADMSAALVMEQANLILVGADQVTPQSVINKIGTRVIALAALERGLPVYALCDTSKFTAHRARAIEDRHSGDELWADAPERVAVLNLYFEPTPLAHFSSLITEDGAIDPADAARRAGGSLLHPALLDALGMKPA